MDSPDIGRTFYKLAIPAVIANFYNLLYSLVDKIFIKMLPDGMNALAGIGVTMPLIMLVSSFSLLVGMAGVPLCAMATGKGDYDEAEKIQANVLLMLLIIGIMLSAVFMEFRDDLLTLFGASEITSAMLAAILECT